VPKKTAKDQAIGICCGGRSTKIDGAVNVVGRPIGLLPGPGQQADLEAVDELAGKIGPCRRLVGDRAYDADRFRQKLRAAGVQPLIPGRRHRSEPIRHDKRRERERWRIEATIGRLEEFRRVATR